MSGLFIRFGTHPRSDLRRGFSRPWGDGDDVRPHAGLSGYDVTYLGLEGALEELVEYFASRGGWLPKSFVTIYSGSEVGIGPDYESLFRPKAIVASVRPLFRATYRSIEEPQFRGLVERLRAAAVPQGSLDST